MTCHCPIHGKHALNALLAADPSRTTMVRYRWIVETNKRFRSLKADIRTSIVDNDCFGIQSGLQFLAAIPPNAFEFEIDPVKVARFMEWLRTEEEAGILQLVQRARFPGQPNTYWTNTYIDSAYMRGIRNSDSWLKRAKAGGSVTMQLPGGIEQAMSRPIHADRVALIYSRTYEDLKSVTAVMNSQIRTQISEGLTTGLARGLAEGKNPRTIARELYKNVEGRVDKIGITRARMVARTEVMNAHNEATMVEYEMAEKAIGQPIMIDVSLGANPCEICVDLEAGSPYERHRAMGLLPAHPNCVCVYLPYIEK